MADLCKHAPLHYALNTTCAQLLLEHGADVNALNREGQTPLSTACRNIGSAPLVSFSLGLGSKVNAEDYSQQTALHAATSNGRYAFIDVLLDAGADISARNNSEDIPLRFAIVFNMHGLLVRMLRDPKADFAGLNNYGQSFAHAIARTADLETVRILAEVGPESLKADMALRDKSGKTCGEYFEEQIAFLGEREGAELREAFGELVDALGRPATKSGEQRPADSGELHSLPDAKCEVTVRNPELFEDVDEDAVQLMEVYHYALEPF